MFPCFLDVADSLDSLAQITNSFDYARENVRSVRQVGPGAMRPLSLCLSASLPLSLSLSLSLTLSVRDSLSLYIYQYYESFSPNFLSPLPESLSLSEFPISFPACPNVTTAWRGLGQGVKDLEDAHAARVRLVEAKVDQLTIWWEQVILCWNEWGRVCRDLIMLDTESAKPS